VYADEAFWWGYGIPNFLRLLLKPLSYTGIDQKILTTSPSHTHWVWLDLRLSVGCVGVGVVTILLLRTFLKYRNHNFTPQQATKIATLVYVSILYTSFYGIFWHIFVLSWLFFSWLITDFLYQNVLRGTEKNILNLCSTWNNMQGAFYARQKK
jgi:O-antigen ligase